MIINLETKTGEGEVFDKSRDTKDIYNLIRKLAIEDTEASRGKMRIKYE